MSVLNNREKLREVVQNSYTYTDVLKVFDLSITGANQKSLKNYIKIFSLDISHFNEKYYLKSRSLVINKWKNEDIFIENSPVATEIIKNRILKEKIFPYVCRKCKNTGSWCGEPITLQLEHKNGNNRDHRLENLEFLCPNCHSQTSTYGRKNINNTKYSETPNKHSPVIISIQNNLEYIINNIHKYTYLDDILTEFKVKLRGEERKVVIDMLKATNNKNVDDFLNNMKINDVKKFNYPDPQVLLDRVNASSYVSVAREIGCSDNAIRKYLRKHNLLK